jgi:UDP-2,3-diacylglucosamine pyrophosphatase LpxH
MGVWSRLFKRRVVETARGDENLLVISDVHLGEDIVFEGPDHLGDYIRALNRELAGFVAHHRRNPVDGRRWHLLINGDMFDFVKVSLRPEPEESPEPLSRRKVDEKSLRSVPNTSENVVWKLERIIEIHRPLFKELAAFLLDGHRITIIEGNHDAEFYFPEVREALRQNLVRLAEQQHRRERRSDDFDAVQVAGRLAFREWFEANPGRYHIEHGHQYDEYSSFEYQLAPWDAEGAPTLATPLSHRAAPYFQQYSAEFTAVGLDKTNLRFWVRWAMSLGARGFWNLFKSYWAMVFALMGKAGPKRQNERSVLRDHHMKRLRAMTEESPYGYATLEQLDTFKATPAEYSRLKMYHGGYFDRFLVAFLMLVAMIPAFFMPWYWVLLWGVGVLFAGSFVLWVASRVGRMDTVGALKEAAAHIAELTGARYVIFGHSHQAELTNLRDSHGIGQYGESSFYINTGSWITREILLGQSGRGMSYVEITTRGAVLRRWLGQEQEPVLIAASDPSALDAPERVE